MQDWGLSLDDVAYIDEETDNEMHWSRVQCGDILLNITGASIGRSCQVNNEIARANVSQHVCVIRLDSAPDRRDFMSWFIKSQVAKDYFAFVQNGAARDGLNFDNISNLRVPLPTTSEMKSISNWLQGETAKIDHLIQKQERLIELLQEKRQAVISHAVTKGLDPTVPMKDSGTEWIGRIPRHWKALRLRFVARLESGHTPSRQHPEWWVDCTIPWFTLADVWQLRQGADEVFETSEKVSELGLTNSSARLLPQGTVMLSRTASVGFSGIMGVPMATTQDFANWVCGDRLIPRFLLLILRAMQPDFERLKYGSTHSTIYMPDINAIRIALPPLNEQEAIVTKVASKTLQIDSLIAKANESVELMKERRSALISAAVTGKIDVREAA